MNREHLLSLLAEDARATCADLAARLGTTEEEVSQTIADLEDTGVIKGYRAIINDTIAASDSVRALIEVKVQPRRDGGFDTVAERIAKFSEVTDVYLVSGRYDLLIEVRGKTLQSVARFVSERLSTIDGVLSTGTVFTLKKYKESGRIMDDDEEISRLAVCP